MITMCNIVQSIINCLIKKDKVEDDRNHKYVDSSKPIWNRIS